MNKNLLLLAGAGAGLLISAASAQVFEQTGQPPATTGLWEVRRHSNISMFVAPSKSPAELERRSEELLTSHGAVMRVCWTAEQRQQFLESRIWSKTCKPEAIRISERTTIADAVCDGTKKVHAEETFDAPGHRPKTVIATIVDTSDAKKDGRTEITYDLPDHAQVIVTLTGLGIEGVPMIEKYDIRRVSNDCGKVTTGRFEPETEPPVTPH